MDMTFGFALRCRVNPTDDYGYSSPTYPYCYAWSIVNPSIGDCYQAFDET